MPAMNSALDEGSTPQLKPIKISQDFPTSRAMDIESSLTTTFLDLPPSCIDFNPLQPDYFVVGSYSLEQQEQQQQDTKNKLHNVSNEDETQELAVQTQKRSGSLLLYHLRYDPISLYAYHATNMLLWTGMDPYVVLIRSIRQIKQTIPTSSAILDLHFHPTQPELLAVATSTGTVEFFSFYDDQLHPLWKHEIASTDTLVLQLAFPPPPSSRAGDGSHDQLAVSKGSVYAATLSSGELVMIASASASPSTSPSSPGLLSKTLEWSFQTFTAHSLEAWSVSFSSSKIFLNDLGLQLYTGGDDSTLLSHDIVPSDPDGTGDYHWQSTITLTDTKTHTAGVTAILPLPYQPGDPSKEIIVTGSYDEHIRVYDPTAKPRDRVLAETNLGGGVWRLKLIRRSEHTASGNDNSVSFLILASCVHAGARVVKVSLSEEGGWEIGVLAKFEEHESMNYASDFRFKGYGGDDGGKEGLTCVSTSFYDRRLCVWQYDPN